MRDIPYYIGAIRARMQNWESKHFEKTRRGKKLIALRNSHKGERCVIVGNGPSLRSEDLDRLKQLGVPTFATNRIYNIFESTSWRPTYYIIEDVDILHGIEEHVTALQAEKKLMPVQFDWYENERIPGTDYFYMDYQSDLQDSYGVSMDVPHGVRCMGTVTTTCFHFAMHMGFSEIYLIGMDHSYSKTVGRDGKITKDSTVQNHFACDNDAYVSNAVFHVDIVTEAYERFEHLSRKIGTFRIFNATRGGKLEVFERADFDSVFQL